MHVQSLRTLSGPNVYSHRPVLLMRLDLGELDGKETREFKGFNDRLLACLPGLNEHQCSLGKPGGFVQRLSEGTYFGHVVEHVAIELAALADVGANHGKTRHSGEPRVYNVAIEYKAEQASRYLLEVAVRLVTAVLNSEVFPVGKEIWEAKQIAVQTELGPSTRAIVDAAERRNIPWRREGEESLVQLGYGKHRHYIQAAMTDRTSATAVELVQDKEYTKILLHRAGIPVPEGRVVRSAADAIAAMHELGAPVVVKPLTGRQGNGVSIGLETSEEMQQAYHDASLFSPSVLVERLLTGRNYRLLVVNNKMIAASERTPCKVVGDGKHTIKELIEAENRNPLRGEGHEKPLTQIRVDQSVVQHLKRIGLTTKYVPHEHEEITLSERVNLSAGATARDVTDEVHPSIKMMCERAARLALVAERVREGGTLVLNADNELVVGIGQQRSVTKRKKRIFYFSLQSDSPIVSEHLLQGGTAFLLQDGWLVEATKRETYRIIDVASVPATMNGLAEFQVANLLAAVAACRAHNVPRYAISRSLKNFTSNTNNPGRVNLYKLNGGHVMVDYGHNPNAFEAICRMASKWEDRRVTGVIGVPGDRDDSLIVHAGRVAARGFDRLIIREDHDLRGRDRGAVAQLLCDAALDEAPETDCQVVLDVSEALHHAVKTMEHGEVVVVFYEKLEPLRQVLEDYAAQPVQSLNAINGEVKSRRATPFARALNNRPALLTQSRSSQPQL